MSGRINDLDVAYIREHVPIDGVIGEYVQLKSAGGGQKKGLCPFHDEKTPSFHVTPSKGYYHCFGCQTGGDVINFVMKMDHTSFVETVERLAERIGYQLRYDETGKTSHNPGLRSRLIAANTAAAKFFQEQLAMAPSAQIGRDLLIGRGFDQASCQKFGVGYAPDDWDQLTKHLRSLGFTGEELEIAGLSKEGQRGMIDRFRHRLTWPIKDISGDIVGFGARKLANDDVDQGPKYLNTPETPIYKKSQVLYGLDMAKKAIASKRQVVVVEGYTDVMAAHLAGIETAVATCGTAFGDDHIRILRRLLMDDDAFRGEVIFTFDGDAAGQKAALRAFSDDQKFVTQTFVAVEPNGLDPCELRQEKGDAALRDLIARRIPLFEFAIKTEIKKHDLQTAEGRVNALTATAPIVAAIRDKSLRPEYVRNLAGWLGMEVETVATQVSQSGGRQIRANEPQIASDDWRLNPNEPTLALEREVLKVKLQLPEFVKNWDELPDNAFSHPAYLALKAAIDQGAKDLSDFDDENLKSLFTELNVELIRSDREVSEVYVQSVCARLHELAISRTVAEIKSKLQRLNPVENEKEYNECFAQLVALEAKRRELRDVALGVI